MLRAWLILSLAMWVTTWVLPGFKVKGFWDAIVVSGVFGVINALIGWLIAVGVVIGTLGLALFVKFLVRWFVNAVVLEVTKRVTSRVRIDSFSTSLAASAIIGIVGAIVDAML
jgi:uncharacterized membrane protein YvlD (DUF360 family)